MPDVHVPEPASALLKAPPDTTLAWQEAMRSLATCAVQAITRAPDPNLIREMVRALGTARSVATAPPCSPAAFTDATPFLARANAVLLGLKPMAAAGGLPTLSDHWQSLLPTRLVGEVAGRLVQAEMRLAEAERLREAAFGCMATRDLTLLEQITAHRDAMQVQVHACILDIRRVASLLGAAGAMPLVEPLPGSDVSALIPSAATDHSTTETRDLLARASSPPRPTTMLEDATVPHASAVGGAADPLPTGTDALPSLERLLDGSFDFSREAVTVGDRYDVRDLIGRGSFGTVLEAFDQRLGRLVALKVMRLPPADGDGRAQLLRRFRQEAQAVARLSHPGIVPVHDFGEGSGFAWIVMELVIGETLRDVLERCGTLPVAEARRITLQLLEALDFAHDRGITHRDIKPANIMLAVDPETEFGRVRLVDFGVARLAGDAGATIMGQMVGTPATMSPEQVRGDVADHRADLWASGVVLYQLLTGTRPFSGGTAAVLASILTDQPKPPSRVRQGIPAGFDHVIARALQKPADRRFSSASEFAHALSAVGEECARGKARWWAAGPIGWLVRALRARAPDS